jgi:TetR/AcrR family transcriptional regulator, mexJK operon transcriptional repressor
VTLSGTPERLDRSLRKRQMILSAGRQLFLSNGYQGTSMDQVAATAAVSKQTVYKHFGEKRALLYAIVTDELDATVTNFRELISELAETTDIEASLIALAMEYLRAVLRDRVVQLRRLVIAEASRLPELAQLYYDRAPSTTLSALADAFRRLHERGLLYAPESSVAAEHFAFLVIGRPMDHALFDGAASVLDSLDIVSHARSGVGVFLAGYRPRAKAG